MILEELELSYPYARVKKIKLTKRNYDFLPILLVRKDRKLTFLVEFLVKKMNYLLIHSLRMVFNTHHDAMYKINYVHCLWPLESVINSLLLY